MNLAKLLKKELVWMACHNCRHGHTYITHQACYERDRPNQRKVGFWDTESSNLTGDMGIILSYAIKPLGEDRFLSGIITRADIDGAKPGQEDKQVVSKLVQDMQQFDVLYGYYSSRHDTPLVRTRAVSLGIPFPAWGMIKQVDLYYQIKFKFRLMSNRLKHANKALLGSTDKTDINWATWRAAARGDKKALVYIDDHCKKDVTDLEKLYEAVKEFSPQREVAI